MSANGNGEGHLDEGDNPGFVFVPAQAPPAGSEPIESPAIDLSSPLTEPVQQMDASLGQYAPFRFLERVSGIPKVFIVFGFLAILCAVLVYFAGLNATGKALAFVVPAFMSYKTLEEDDVNEHIHWLTYWLVYGVFESTRLLWDNLFHWLPYWELAKFVFLVWCALPQSRGCSFMYRAILRPMFLHHEETIDYYFDRIGRHVVKIASEVRDVGAELFKAIFVNMVQTVMTTAKSKDAPAVSPANANPNGPSPSPSPASRNPSPRAADMQKKQF